MQNKQFIRERLECFRAIAQCHSNTIYKCAMSLHQIFVLHLFLYLKEGLKAAQENNKPSPMF